MPYYPPPAASYSPGLASIASAVAIANTEAQAIGVTIAANAAASGTSYRVQARGTMVTTVAAVATFRVRFGPTTLIGNIPTSLAVNTSNINNTSFAFDALITVRTTGSGGTVIGECALIIGMTTFSYTLSAIAATVAINTTVANILELTCISGNAGQTLNFQNAVIDIAKA